MIAAHLQTIAGQERVEIDGAALHAVARGADGCMRDAESALDQLISFCGDRIVESDVLSMFGLTAQGQILALGGHLFRGEAAPALNEINQLAKQGKDLGRLLADLLAHCRNLLLFLISDRKTDLLEVTETEADALANQAEETDADALTRIMEVLTEAEGGYRTAASKRIFLEIAVLRAIQARQAVPLGAVLERLEQYRNQSPSGGAESKSPLRATPSRPASNRPEESAAPRSSRSTAANSGAADKTATALAEATEPATEDALPAPTSLEEVWVALLESVGRASAFTRSYLIQAHPVSLTDRMLTLGIDPEFSDQLELLNNQRTLTLLQTKLRELGRAGMSVRFVKAEAPPEAARGNARQTEPATILEDPIEASPAPSAAAARRDPSPASAEKAPDIKNDPLIKKALELFKGQIVQVRG
jgi:DNA polymerase-3 subunit gamma/tau